MNCDGLAMEVPSLLPACILLAFFTVFGHCCGPAEIGQKYILNSTANVNDNVGVEWILVTLAVLYRSKKNGDEENFYPNVYVGTRTHLTIVNVSIKNSSEVFQQSVNEEPVYNCTLPIYKRARTPKCEKVELEGNYLKTTCTTKEVFPQAKCQFTLENGKMDKKNITDETSYITYTYSQPGGTDYYSTSCTLQYPVKELEPGNWTVRVNMYPDLTGVSLAQGTTEEAGIYVLSNYSLTNQPEKKDSLPLAAVVGGAVGAVVLIAVAVVVGVIFYIMRGHIDNSDPSNAYAFKDNSELDGNAAAAGYNPHQDPTAVFIDNSELYATASKGYNPHQDPTAVFIDNSELYATASKGYNPHQDPTAVFTDNSELYATASKGYNPHKDPTAVFTDSSELYATSSKEPSQSLTARNDNPEPTVMCANALSKTYTPETGLNPYDDIDQEEQKREQKLLATKSKTQATTETPEGPPQYSVSNEEEVDLDAHTWI